MNLKRKSLPSRVAIVGSLGLLALCTTSASGQMVTGSKMTDFNAVFGLTESPRQQEIEPKLTACSIPGNILWPDDKPTFTVTVTNKTSAPLTLKGKVSVIAYGTKGKSGDIWTPTVVKFGDSGAVPVILQLNSKGASSFTISPTIPARFGAYALILDLGAKHGKHFLTSCVRTFRPQTGRIQYPSFCLDNLGVDVLSRLGVHAIRWGITYKPTSDKNFEEWYQQQSEELRRLNAANITVLAMFGGGDFYHQNQPLGRPRPWLDDKGTMQDTKFDLAWLPSYDPDFKKMVARLIKDYGWPKGPITAVSLWNEPWEGISISGWGADMPRYREIYSAMVEGVKDARRDGADVLVGGCDSSSNALDKLFGDGSDKFLPYFDFLSVHYQGMQSFATYKPFVDRRTKNGRVKIWDTESWVANTDDRVAAVVATNRAAGYDRAMGVYGGNISDSDPHTDGGANAWPVAASVGAVQYFIGDREFKTLLFLNGLPWVMVFDGRNGNQEDGTVVVVGDIGEEFGTNSVAFRTARGLTEMNRKETIRTQLSTLSASQLDAPIPGNKSGEKGSKPLTLRQMLLHLLETDHTLTDASITIVADGQNRYSLFDFYGNPVPTNKKRITIPLDGRGFFLRGNGKPGSFAALLASLKTGQIRGVEALAIQVHDLTSTIETNPELRLTVTNVLNRIVTGNLAVNVGGIKLQQPSRMLTLKPNETRTVTIRVSGGKPNPSNSYPLAVHFGAGDTVATHFENLHVNIIANRKIDVDGNLADWDGVLPQTIVAPGDASPTITEAAWFPFKKFDVSTGSGLATGYVASDDDNFYFAAKVADTTPDGGTFRFETLDADQFFYPERSFAPVKHFGGAPEAPLDGMVWPEGVRRYSYRKDPVLPAGNAPNFDNVQIAFNVLPTAEKRFYPHPPGTFTGFTTENNSSDYEFALNKVAQKYGGGTEIWRLSTPKMPLKHFYPRQGKSPFDGPVRGGKLVILQELNTRIVECAIPWSEIPEVMAAKKAGTPIQFSFRINDSAGIGCMELARGRSIAKTGGSFHAEWVEHWENKISFGWESSRH